MPDWIFVDKFADLASLFLIRLYKKVLVYLGYGYIFYEPYLVLTELYFTFLKLQSHAQRVFKAKKSMR